MAVALHRGFYNTLPTLEEVNKADADMAWLIYDMPHDVAQNRYQLVTHKIIYTKFEAALLKITRSEAGDEGAFMGQLQAQLNRRLNSGGKVPNTIDTSL